MTDYLTPGDPMLIEADPTRLSNWGGDNPPIGVTGGIRAGYKRAIANNRYAYQLRIGDAVSENNKKMRSVGLNPPDIMDTAFHIPIIGAYLSDFDRATDFQHIMASGALIAGPDERYEHATQRSNKVRQDILAADKMAEEAKIKHPELGIKTTDEMHTEVVNELKQAMMPDPRASWLAGVGDFLGGAGNIASPSDPFAPLKTALAGFGGIGASTVTRAASLGLTFAGLGLAEEATDPAARRRMLGMPEHTAGDLAFSALTNFTFGAAFGVIGEGLMGQSSRQALNESWSWLSLSKREAKIAPLLPSAREPPPPPAPPPPPGPTAAELAGRPASLGATEKLGQAPPGLPGLPRGNLPTTAVGALAEQIPIPVAGGGLGGPNARELTEGAALAYVPRDERVRVRILDRFDTKATKTREAKQLDHTMAQLMTDGVAPQDIIAATRALDEAATRMPDIRVWQGPGTGVVRSLAADFKKWISQRVDHLVAADPKSDIAERAAREFDPDTWKKTDKILRELNTEKEKLQRTVDLHQKAAVGDKKALDAIIMAHEAERMRARTPEGRARVLREMKETQDYFTALKKVRPGGERPPAPKHLDQAAQVERVAALEARRDALYPDIEKSFANSQGLLDLNAEEREALETYIRGTTRDWINGSFRWPKGVKRLRKDKNPYDIKQTVGPTKKELFAQRELDMAQLSDPEAIAGAKPGEGPVDVATRVNEVKRKDMEENVLTPEFNAIGDFLELMEERRLEQATQTVLPKEQVAKINAAWLKDPAIIEGWQLDIFGNVIDSKTRNVIGYLETTEETAKRAKAEGLIGRPGGQPPGLIPKPVVPRLASGEAYGNLAEVLGFDLDGKAVGMKQAWEDVKSELEALKAFQTCSVVL